MTVDGLQRVFKTLTDPTRIRILALLEREELAVQDLEQVLGVAQSTVSRHLAILRDAGLLRDRREGTYAYYRFITPTDGAWQQAWCLAQSALRDDPIAERDTRALESLLRERSLESRAWFDAIGAEWDAKRKVLRDDVQRARAIAKLVPIGMRVADIGTGTGILAHDLARSGVNVVAIDHSRRMLASARSKLAAEGIENVDLRHGDAAALPLADGEVDAALAHMVLHYVASPGEAIREMARVVRPGGRVVVVDFVQTDSDWVKRELGAIWQGFAIETMRAWFAEAGLDDIAIEEHGPHEPDGATAADDSPTTFIAAARRPESTKACTE